MMRSPETVQEVDEVARQFARRPDRPDCRFVRLRRDDVAMEKAKQRLRTAAWRDANDRKGRPTAEQIGKALLMAVCTSADFKRLLDADLSIVAVAVEDMVLRGFDRGQVHDVMRRIRHRHVDPADRVGEATETTSDPIVSSCAQRVEDVLDR
jgi:hypothetical protein